MKKKARVMLTHDVEVDAEYGDDEDALKARAIAAAQADDIPEYVSVVILDDETPTGPPPVAEGDRPWHPSEMESPDPADTAKNLERATPEERAAYDTWRKSADYQTWKEGVA